MTASTCNASDGRGAWRVLAALAVLAALCAITVLVGADADPASAARAQTLGKTKRSPAPLCPGEDCAALGSVTGFQVKAGGKKNLFKMPRNGRIVAFSVDLAKPNSKERKFFGKVFSRQPFGGSPTARIAVLRKGNEKKYKLLRQSPVVELAEHYGQKPIFTLGDPLRAQKGEVIALTTPTWIPAFSTGGRGNVWRGSRKSGKCGQRQARKARPQQRIGSSREYGCRFGDRLLYWAYYEAG